MSGSTGEKPPVLVWGTGGSVPGGGRGAGHRRKRHAGPPKYVRMAVEVCKPGRRRSLGFSDATLEISRTKRPQLQGSRMVSSLAAVFPDFSDELG